MQPRNPSASNSGSPNAKLQPGNSDKAFADLIGSFSLSASQANAQKPLNSLALKPQQQQEKQTSMGSMQPIQSTALSNLSNQSAMGGKGIGAHAAGTITNGNILRLPNSSSVGGSGPPPLQPNYNSMGLDGLDPFARSVPTKSNNVQQQQASNNTSAAGSVLNPSLAGAPRTNTMTSVTSSALSISNNTLFQSLPGRNNAPNTMQPFPTTTNTSKANVNNIQQGNNAFDLLGVDMLSSSKPGPASSSTSITLNGLMANQNTKQPPNNKINPPPSSAWDQLDLLASGSKGFTAPASSSSNNDPFDLEFLSQKKTHPFTDAKQPQAEADNDEFLGFFSQPTQSKISNQKSGSLGVDARDVLLQEGVEKLSGMGFDSLVSRKALIDADLDLNKAIASLVNGTSSSSKSSSSVSPALKPTSSPGVSFVTSDQKVENATQDLMKMGFEYNVCKAALVSAGLDKQAAIAILVSDSGTPKRATNPSSSSSSPSRSFTNSGEMSKINQLMQTGFGESDCRSALKMSGGNIEAAMELLLNKPLGNFEDEIKYSSSSTNTSTRFDPNSLVGAASQIGFSVFKNAKTAFTIAKKKVGEVLNEKTGTQSNPVSEKDWASANFKDSSDAIGDEYGVIREEGENRGTIKAFSSQVHSLHRQNSNESIDVPLERRSKNTTSPIESRTAAPTQTANLLQLDKEDNLVELYSASNPLAQSSKSSPRKQALPSNTIQSLRTAVDVPIPLILATDAQLQTSNSHRESGNEFFKQGQFGDAEAQYTLGIDSLPDGHVDLIPLYNNRAACRLKNGDNKGAAADCDYILQKIPEDLKALIRRATAYEALESWEKARDDYRKIMGIDPYVKGCSIGLARANAALQPKLEAPPSSSHSDFKPPKQMASSVKKAVDEAVQKVRESNEAKEQLENEKFEASESVDKKIENWKSNKEANIRALLASLDTVLWPECGWKPVTLGDLISPTQVKKRYIQAVAKVHPDKLGSTCTVEQQLVASSVFTVLNKAWDAFKIANNL